MAKMPKHNLTGKQEIFCIEYVKCGNASAAYRHAYDSDKMLRTTIHRKAVDVMANGNVTARIVELQALVVEDCRVTLTSHLAKLHELRDIAQADNNLPAAIRAEELCGKASGIYINKIEDITPEKPIINVVFMRAKKKN